MTTRSFSRRTDLRDTVYAADVNELQAAIEALSVLTTQYDLTIGGVAGAESRISMITFGITHLGYVNIVWYGAVGDGVTDNSTAIQAAIDAAATAGVGVYIPPGDFLFSTQLKTTTSTHMFGSGPDSNLEADGITGAAILTYPGSGETTCTQQYLHDFNISGTATCAIAFSHFVRSVAERLTLFSFTGSDGYVFEYFWGSSFNNLSTNGATISRACFKVNKGVLDSLWNLSYTSNFSDWSLYIDSSVQEYSTGTAVGWGVNTFDTFTAQGADVGALGIIQTGAGQLTFRNLYTENVLTPLILGHHTSNGGRISFYDCNFVGDRSATEISAIIQKVSQVRFLGGQFDDKNIILGAITAGIVFDGVQRVSNAELMSILRKTGDTTTAAPITIINPITTAHSRIVMKTTDFLHKFYEMAIDGTGAWAATSKTLSTEDWQPITSLTYSAGTATATCVAHGYSTGNAVKIQGASPKAYNNAASSTYTITVTDANTFTYTPGSAPSATPAIGQPMVYKP